MSGKKFSCVLITWNYDKWDYFQLLANTVCLCNNTDSAKKSWKTFCYASLTQHLKVNSKLFSNIFRDTCISAEFSM